MCRIGDVFISMLVKKTWRMFGIIYMLSKMGRMDEISEYIILYVEYAYL